MLSDASLAGQPPVRPLPPSPPPQPPPQEDVMYVPEAIGEWLVCQPVKFAGGVIYEPQGTTG